MIDIYNVGHDETIWHANVDTNPPTAWFNGQTYVDTLSSAAMKEFTTVLPKSSGAQLSSTRSSPSRLRSSTSNPRTTRPHSLKCQCRDWRPTDCFHPDAIKQCGKFDICSSIIDSLLSASRGVEEAEMAEATTDVF